MKALISRQEEEIENVSYELKIKELKVEEQERFITILSQQLKQMEDK